MKTNTNKYPVPSAKTMMNWVNAFYDLGARRPGHPAGRRAEELCERLFKELGLKDVSRDPFKINCWDASGYSLELGPGGAAKKFSPFYVPYSKFTPDAGIEAGAVYLGEGEESVFKKHDVKGKLAVMDIPFVHLKPGMMKLLATATHDPEGYFPTIKKQLAVWGRPTFHAVFNRALKAGAAGFLGLLNELPAGNTYYAPYDGIERALPGLYLGKAESARFKSALVANPSGLARFKLTGKRWDGETANVYGWLPGTSDETIMVGSHHDSPFASAVEDGSGMAVVLGIAAALAPTAGKRKRNVLFLGSAGHFHGSCGARHMMRNRLDILGKVVCEIHMEHICRAAEPLPDASGYKPLNELESRAFFFTPSKPLKRALARIMSEHDLRRIMALPLGMILGRHPPTDGGFYSAANIPIINYIAGPPYLLSDDDVPAMVADFELERTVAAIADLVDELDTVPAEALGKKPPDMRKTTEFLDTMDRLGSEEVYFNRLNRMYQIEKFLDRFRKS
jgi:hypothetical protein